MYKLRQRTWGVYIRPYVEFGGDNIVQRGKVFVPSPCPGDSDCIPYIQVKDGEPWILYKGKYLTSFILVRELVKEIMDELGYSINDIVVNEVIPVDHIVTPLA